jgi:nucleoside-diphosphate-sugar epimerase
VTNGHSVTALVQSDEQAEVIRARGAGAAVADLYDTAAVAEAFGGSDGAVHTASPGDEKSADMDSAVVDAAIDAYGTTGKPYVHISGLWIYGSNLDITEHSEVHAPPMVAWKEPIQQRLLDATGMRGVVVVSGVAYGDGGGGIPGVLLGSPRDEQGNLIMLGDGEQHWATVHVADLANFFRHVLENGAARGTYVIGNGHASTVAEITRAASVAAGGSGAVPGSVAEARARLGDYFAEVLLLDQGTQAGRAHTEMGWRPTRPGLVEEFQGGSYRR